MITDEPWQGKPAVGVERPVAASRGQGNAGRVKAPLNMDWTNLVQFVQYPREADVTHGYYFSLPKNRPKGAPDDTVTQSSLKQQDPFILFGECKDGHRDDNHLMFRSAVTLDYDQPDALRLMRRLKLEAIAVPFAYVWHTTRSHDLNIAMDRVQPKIRIIVPLSRDVSAIEYRLLVRGLSRLFAATLDEASLKPSQMMYCPIHNKGARYSYGAFAGTGYLEPDSILAGMENDPVAQTERKLDRQRSQGRDESGEHDPLYNAKPPLRDISVEQIEDDLDKLDPDIEYDDWITVIRAVHHQTMGSEEGFDLVDTWSSGGAKYEDGIVREKWDELTHSPKNGQEPQTYATILHWMKEHRAKKAKETRDAFIAEINECTNEQQLETKLIERIARTTELTKLGRKKLGELLIKRQKIVLGVALSAAEMRKAIEPQPVKQTAVAMVSATGDNRYTEMGNTELLYDRIGRNLIFIPELQVWYRWSDGYWKEYPVEAIRRSAAQVIDDMTRNIPDGLNNAQIGEYLAWCIKSQTKHMVDAMVSLLPSTPGSNMIVPGAMLDSNNHLLGVRNGVLDLHTGELREASRDDLITHVTACAYDADAGCPLFEQVVSDAFFGDRAMIDWFQRVLGYSLLGNPREQFFVIPYGNGSNGKSTILNAVRDVFGAYATSTPYTTFLTDGRNQASAGGPTEHLLRLKGKRFVYMSEPESGLQIRTSLVKSVTGGDALTARGVHGRKSVEFKPTWVIFMPTNHKPVVPDEDHGIWRRMKLLPFDRNFDDDKLIEKDTALDEKLKAEYEGILAWCVAGARLYLSSGLGSEPHKVKVAHDEYRTSMDVLADWLEDCWTVTGDFSDRVSALELWASWEKYAGRTGTLYLCNSSKSLGRRLANRKFRTWRSTKGRGFCGLIRKDRSANEQGFGD